MHESPHNDQGEFSDDASEGGAAIDPWYYADGVRWEEDTYRALRRSRSIAWMITGVFGATTVLSLSCLALLLPLKQFEPYVVTVDRSTGYREVARARSNRATFRRMRP